MKITIYTISDCPFCQAEKDYLAQNNLNFEEKNVEQNREFLGEMLELSEKGAVVPFTVIIKDSGEEVKLRGFTKEEFDVALGLVQTTSQSDQKASGMQTTGISQHAPSTPVSNEALKGVMDNSATMSGPDTSSPPPQKQSAPAPTVEAASPVQSESVSQPLTDATDATDVNSTISSPSPLSGTPSAPVDPLVVTSSTGKTANS